MINRQQTSPFSQKTQKQIFEFPDCLRSKAIDMNSIGVLGYAFDYQDTIAVLDFCKDKQIAILGGDVLELKKGKLSYTYENWFIDVKNYSSYPDFVIESYKISLNYLTNILEGAECRYFNLVFCKNEREFRNLHELEE